MPLEAPRTITSKPSPEDGGGRENQRKGDKGRCYLHDTFQLAAAWRGSGAPRFGTVVMAKKSATAYRPSFKEMHRVGPPQELEREIWYCNSNGRQNLADCRCIECCSCKLDCHFCETRKSVRAANLVSRLWPSLSYGVPWRNSRASSRCCTACVLSNSDGRITGTVDTRSGSAEPCATSE